MNTHPQTRLFLPLPQFIFLLVAAAILLCAAGCRTEAPPPKPSGPLPVNSFMRHWRTNLELKNDPIRSIHVRDNSIFAYTRSGQVASLKREGGGLEFINRIAGGNTTLHPPVVLQEFVSFPTATTVESYTHDGRFVRSSKLDFAVRSPAAGFGTNLFMGGDFPRGGARVAKVDVTQEYVPLVWSMMGLTAGKHGFSAAPAVVGDAVYIGGTDGNVYAVAATNRESIWPTEDAVFKTSGPIVADVAADMNGVFVASTDSVLYALNPNNGHRLWQYFTGVPLRDAPVITPDRVYIRVEGQGLAGLSRELPVNEQVPSLKYNRQPLWIAPDAVQFLAQDDKYAYVRGRSNHIIALDKTTGEEIFRSKRRDLAVFGSNTKPDGTIFAATRDGRVMAIRPVLRPGVIGEQVQNDQPAWEISPLALR